MLGIEMFTLSYRSNSVESQISNSNSTIAAPKLVVFFMFYDLGPATSVRHKYNLGFLLLIPVPFPHYSALVIFSSTVTKMQISTHKN